MQNLVSDNAVLIVAAFFVFAILLFRKELAERLSKLNIPVDILSKVDDFFNISKDIILDVGFLEEALRDGKLTADEVKEIIMRLGNRRLQLEELLQ